jgi:hypothetical protein
LAEIGGQVAHHCLQRRLGDAHHVVVRHHPHRAAIGQRQDRAAFVDQRRRALRHLGERIGRDHHGAREVVARRHVEIAALELRLVGKADGVDQEVDRCPIPFSVSNTAVNGGDVLDVAWQQQFEPISSASGFTRRPKPSPW